MGVLAIAGAVNTTVNKLLDFIQVFYSPTAVTTRLRKKTIASADTFTNAFDTWGLMDFESKPKYFRILIKRRKEYKNIRRRIR